MSIKLLSKWQHKLRKAPQMYPVLQLRRWRLVPRPLSRRKAAVANAIPPSLSIFFSSSHCSLLTSYSYTTYKHCRFIPLCVFLINGCVPAFSTHPSFLICRSNNNVYRNIFTHKTHFVTLPNRSLILLRFLSHPQTVIITCELSVVFLCPLLHYAEFPFSLLFPNLVSLSPTCHFCLNRILPKYLRRFFCEYVCGLLLSSIHYLFLLSPLGSWF